LNQKSAEQKSALAECEAHLKRMESEIAKLQHETEQQQGVCDDLNRRLDAIWKLTVETHPSNSSPSSGLP